MREPLVTAIVSTYAAERYLRGCLQDLVEQTLGDALEILVIDAGSPENEAAIVHEFQQQHGNIRYLRTPTRENSSQVFNRATLLARGRYLTTANADDRHRPDFCERLAAVLDAHPEFGLVYADALITHADNETWARNTASRRYAWPDYTPTIALACCPFGAQPMWRRAAHEQAGRWDETLVHANDLDLFSRIARSCGAVHLREDMGLFLDRRDSVSGADHRAVGIDATMRVLRRHRSGASLEQLFPALADHAGDPLARASALFELGNLGALGPYTDAQFALDRWRQALDLPCPPADVPRVRAAYANNTGCVLAAIGARPEAERALRLAADLPAAQRNLARARAAFARGQKPRLLDLAFVELLHPVVVASRRTRGLAVAADGGFAWSAAHEQVPWDVYEGPNGVPIAPAQAPLPPPQAPLGKAPRTLIVMYGWADCGGGTLLPRQVAKAMAARGRAVAVFYAAARPDASLPAHGLRRGREDGVELFGLCNRTAPFSALRAPLGDVDDPASRAAFDGVLAEFAPDVVHFFNLHGLGMSLPQACRARGIPSVFSTQNFWALCPRLYLLDERLQRCSGASDDGSKCAQCLGEPSQAAGYAERRRVGRELLEELVDVHLVSSPRLREIYVQNGFDPARIRIVRQQPPGTEAIWRQTGSARPIVDRLQRPLRLGFLGSVMPHKGVHVLAAALQLLPPGAVECVVLGEAQADYVAWLRQLDRRQALHFASAYAADSLPELLARLDVVVVPSVVEEIGPMVVAEALAARAPVIGSRIGGIPDFVVDGRNGMLFPPGDGPALAQCLLAFGRDPRLLGRMQRAIREPAGFAAYLDELEAVYREVAEPQAIAGSRS